MRYAIMSDVHANPKALEEALADARWHSCRKFVFLGDVTGYGYDASAALSLVRKSFNVILMGNHDSACVGLESGWMVIANPNYDLDREQREGLSEEEVEYLRHLPYEWRCGDFAAAHGNFVRPDKWDYIFSTETAMQSFFATDARLMFCGHTHHAALWEATSDGVFRGRFASRFTSFVHKPESVSFSFSPNTRYIINVGSVGNPRNDLCVTYVIYDSDDDRVIFRRLPFDFESYGVEMVKRGVALPEWFQKLLEFADYER